MRGRESSTLSPLRPPWPLLPPRTSGNIYEFLKPLAGFLKKAAPSVSGAPFAGDVKSRKSSRISRIRKSKKEIHVQV